MQQLISRKARRAIAKKRGQDFQPQTYYIGRGMRASYSWDYDSLKRRTRFEKPLGDVPDDLMMTSETYKEYNSLFDLLEDME